MPGSHPATTSTSGTGTVTLDGSVPGEELLELIDHSYDLVVARLTRPQRSQLAT